MRQGKELGQTALHVLYGDILALQEFLESLVCGSGTAETTRE